MQDEKVARVSFGRLFLMVWSRLPMIILWFVIFSALGLTIALTSPDKYQVSAVIKTKWYSGITNYSNSEIAYYLKNNMYLEPYADEKHPLKDIKLNLSVKADNNTGYIKIQTQPVKDTAYWENMITDIIEKMDSDIMAEYESRANTQLDNLKKSYDSLMSVYSESQQKENISLSNIVLQLTELTNSMEEIDHALLFVESPHLGDEPVGSSKAVICIAFAFIGCVIGGILTLIAGFSDKKLYFSEDAKEIVGENSLARVIPEYKTPAQIDSRDFSYLSFRIKDNEKNVSVISLTKEAGVTTIAKGIVDSLTARGKIATLTDCNENSGEGITLIDEGSIHDNPSILDHALKSDRTFVIVRREHDSVTSLRKAYNEIDKLGIRNVSYVFNGAYRNDSNIVKYLEDKNYKRMRYKFWK